MKYTSIVRSIVEKGADINFTDDWGNTALMFAAYNGRERVVKELLDLGADINIRNHDGRDALSLAKNPEVVKMLSR